jgi:hypothetical protein
VEASQQFSFLQVGLLAPRPTPIPEEQASVFISPRGRVATHFSRLLRHAWVTVGLFLFRGHHTGNADIKKVTFFKWVDINKCNKYYCEAKKKQITAHSYEYLRYMMSNLLCRTQARHELQISIIYIKTRVSLPLISWAATPVKDLLVRRLSVTVLRWPYSLHQSPQAIN